MDNTLPKDLYQYLNDPKEVSDEQTEIIRNTLLYPIGKAFLEKYPQYHDIITTYEEAVESIANIVENDAVIDTFIEIDATSFANFKLNVRNVTIHSPDSIEALEHSNYGYIPTPNIALATRGLYSVVVIGDIHYSYTLYHKNSTYDSYLDLVSSSDANSDQPPTFSGVVNRGYVVNVPIPVGCKWCTLHHYDPITRIKSGEEFKSMYGYFIVDGFLRNIIPIYKKPFNKPVVWHNTFDEQLARCDGIYTRGFEYEQSYTIVGAIVIQKSARVGRGGQAVTLPDFGFSLQLNHATMNVENVFAGKHTKKLFNFVPIKFLFTAFGCPDDERMLKYICPQMNDFGLINTVSHACLQGYKHREAVKTALLKVKPDSEYIIYEEPLTEFVAKYVIGCIILSQKTKEDLLSKCHGADGKINESDYKVLIVQTVTHILNERFMPGIPPGPGRNSAICVELGTIVAKLYYVGYGLEPEQDKMSLINRRVRNGQQLSREFKAFHNVRTRECLQEVRRIFQEKHDRVGINQTLQNRMQTIAKSMSKDQSQSLINAFKGTSKDRSKLRTDLITCKNQAFVWNHLREIVISSELKVVGATVSWDHRTVHQSDMFFICPTQTPESGSQTGRFKTPTLYTYITVSTVPDRVKELISRTDKFIIDISEVDYPAEYFTIRINGCVLGYIPECDPVEQLYLLLLHARREEKIEKDTSVILNRTAGVLDVWTDTGRLVTPFVNISESFDHSPDYSSVTPKKEFCEWLERCAVEIDQFDDGIRKGFIELFCPEMAIYNAVIAPSLKEFYQKPRMYTHIALPNHLHGIIAGVVPAMNLNAGVRGAYLTNHVKQAIGPVIEYPSLKYVNDNNILIAPQVPLVRPCTYDYLHLNERPYGNNIIVAFMQFKYNQEDAIILNQASVEQGLLKIDSITTKMHKIDKNTDEFRIPPEGTMLNGNPDSYGKLDPATSLPKNVSDIFYQNDALIAKTVKTPEGVSDTSILNEKPDGKYPVSANPRPLRCIVKNKIHGENKVLKVQAFGQYRVPIVGDKFNSEHAQKGTCGRVMPPELLPYNSTGVRPDIIFNPPAIFKRKTFGQVYLPVMAKISALLGCPIDCTPYHTIRSEEELYKILRELGLSEAGYETMYDAITGRPYRAKIFFANHYWERQSHLVEQKINVRNGGPRDAVTGQPAKGRKHGGGQSFDRMSFDAFVAAGICELSRDIHLNQGSKIQVAFCKRCHCLNGYFHRHLGVWMCPRCGAHEDMEIKEVPPATLLVNHAMNGLHVAIDYFEDASNENNIIGNL